MTNSVDSNLEPGESAKSKQTRSMTLEHEDGVDVHGRAVTFDADGYIVPVEEDSDEIIGVANKHELDVPNREARDTATVHIQGPVAVEVEGEYAHGDYLVGASDGAMQVATGDENVTDYKAQVYKSVSDDVAVALLM